MGLMLLAVFSGCGGESTEPIPEGQVQSVTIEGPTMGTHFIIKISRASDAAALERASSNAVSLLERIDGMMSTYKPTSELSRFNQHQSTEPFKVSKDMIDIFLLAREVSDVTNGAFDVTIGPIVNAWGFGPEKRAEPPTDQEIASLLPRVGFEMVLIDVQTSTLRKARPDIYCDLSGIAQGYAADQVATVLDSAGITDYMIDISGEFRTRGVNDSGNSWQIAIERPDAQERTAHIVLPLSNLSLATSGDYRNFTLHEGKRISHEIDPATGYPITHRLASVTVITSDCTRADAYATAFMVMGPEAGYALATERNFAAYFLVRTDNGTFEELRTPKFSEMLSVVQ